METKEKPKSFSEFLSEMFINSDPRFQTIATILGKTVGGLAETLDKSGEAGRILLIIKIRTFAEIFRVLSDHCDEIQEFAKLTKGSRLGLMVITDHASVERIAKETGMSFETLSRHLKGSRATERSENRLLRYFNKASSPQREEKVPAIAKPAQASDTNNVAPVWPREEVSDFIASSLSGTSKILHRFIFQRSTPEERAKLREQIGSNFEKLRLAVIALGSETIFREVIEHHPELKQGRDK